MFKRTPKQVDPRYASELECWLYVGFILSGVVAVAWIPGLPQLGYLLWLEFGWGWELPIIGVFLAIIHYAWWRITKWMFEKHNALEARRKSYRNSI